MEGAGDGQDAERRTRSGRKLSAAGTKRKRTDESEETEPLSTRAKMTNPKGTTWTWEDFTAHLSKELDRNKNETVAGINGRLDATEASLREHREQVSKEMTSMKADIAALQNQGRDAPKQTEAYKNAVVNGTASSGRISD